MEWLKDYWPAIPFVAAVVILEIVFQLVIR